MKMIAWLLLLCCIFIVALALALTFTQPVFRDSVSVKLLFFPDREIQMYIFVLGVFIAGLGLGTATALIVFVKAKMAAVKKNRRIRELEAELAGAVIHPNTAVSQGTGSAAQSPGSAEI